MMAPPEPEQAQPDEEEVIHLSGAEPEPEPAPEPSLPAPQEQRPGTPIVYLQPAMDETKERARRQAALTKVKRYRESFPSVKAMPFDESWSTSAIESHLENIRTYGVKSNYRLDRQVRLRYGCQGFGGRDNHGGHENVRFGRSPFEKRRNR